MRLPHHSAGHYENGVGDALGMPTLTEKLADEHGKPFLHVDLDATNPFAAAKAITYWLAEHDIEVLNVAGPRLSKEPRIYDEVKKILTSVILLSSVSEFLPKLNVSPPLIPSTVEEAVEDLISKLSLKDKTNIAKMDEEELSFLYPALVSISEKNTVCGQ